MGDKSDDEFYAGYLDGLDSDNPEPSANRSHCYRHSFMIARSDKRGEPVYGAREMAAEAERKDRESEAASCWVSLAEARHED